MLRNCQLTNISFQLSNVSCKPSKRVERIKSSFRDIFFTGHGDTDRSKDPQVPVVFAILSGYTVPDVAMSQETETITTDQESRSIAFSHGDCEKDSQ